MGTSASYGFICCRHRRDRCSSIKRSSTRYDERALDSSDEERVMDPEVVPYLHMCASTEKRARNVAMEHANGSHPIAPLTREISEASTRASSKQSYPDCDSFGHMSRITRRELRGILEELPRLLEPWARGNFSFVRKLQDAVRNEGRVDLMEMPSNGGKRSVAVKQMPNTWMQAGPSEFKKASPTSMERPWHDFAFVKMLNQRGCPYVCNLIGMFADDANTYVVSQFAAKGDLFDWCSSNIGPRPDVSHTREAVIKPYVIQIFDAVRWIHTLGISHRDLSLENILLHEDVEGTRIKLIDFGMSTLKRWCCKEVCGKSGYRAPEIYEPKVYDAFLTDAFALGVVVFGMAVQDYPFSSQQETCPLFECFCTVGFMKFLQDGTLQNGMRMQDIISAPLAELLGGLLSAKPQDRFTLGEGCWAAQDCSRRSVWDMSWVQEENESRLMSVSAPTQDIMP